MSSAYLHDDDCDEKIKNFTPDDSLVNPNDPVSTGDLLQLLHPDCHHTEGVVEAFKWTTLRWRSQTVKEGSRGTHQGWGLVSLYHMLIQDDFFCSHTSRQCIQLWTRIPQRRGRRGGRWRLSASELLCLFSVEADSSGSDWPEKEQQNSCTFFYQHPPRRYVCPLDHSLITYIEAKNRRSSSKNKSHLFGI